MKLLLKASVLNATSALTISGSKSETNRLLLLQALYPNIVLKNTSNSDDSEVMLKALQNPSGTIDVHHAGTAMRFLTAFFAVQEGKEVVLTGSGRMQERPIKILVDALRQLGAAIQYETNEGFPPLRIQGKKLVHNKVTISAEVSSQYISALLLVAPKLENGLELILEGEITSLPYIHMTLQLLEEIGVNTSFEANTIRVQPLSQIMDFKPIIVESDWSSASYFYSLLALSAIGTEIRLSSYKAQSHQGDAVLAQLYEQFGVATTFEDTSIRLLKIGKAKEDVVHFHLNETPDIAQTIAVTCFGLGISCHLTGLHTLKIKETDRLQALQNELTKLGATVSVTDDSVTLSAAEKIHKGVTIATYQDHRMAMAFAPLALRTDIVIQEAEVVSKSCPNFWKDLKNIGMDISEV